MNPLCDGADRAADSSLTSHLGQKTEPTQASLSPCPALASSCHFPESSESSYKWNSELLGCKERSRGGVEVHWDQLDDLEMGLQTRILSGSGGGGLRSREGFQGEQSHGQMAAEKDHDAGSWTLA